MQYHNHVNSIVLTALVSVFLILGFYPGETLAKKNEKIGARLAEC